MLREYWFPLLLTVFGFAMGMLAVAAEGYARKMWISTCVLLFALSTLSFIWGDPVRGPFYGALHPSSSKNVELYAGIVAEVPIKSFASGVKFEDLILLPNNPIRLHIKKNWWSGSHYDLSVLAQKGGYTEILRNNEFVEHDVLPNGLDVNFDDSAVEIVTQQGYPVFQLIINGDYNIHVNAVVLSDLPNRVIVIKDTLLLGNVIPDQSDFPPPIFHYPSYANRGKRL